MYLILMYPLLMYPLFGDVHKNGMSLIKGSLFMGMYTHLWTPDIMDVHFFLMWSLIPGLTFYICCLTLPTIIAAIYLNSYLRAPV